MLEGIKQRGKLRAAVFAQDEERIRIELQRFAEMTSEEFANKTLTEHRLQYLGHMYNKQKGKR